jgi:lipid-A-disaccharide synthase
MASNGPNSPSPRILISAGEASGDLYAAALVEALQRHVPAAEFFGCAGPRMQAAGVRPVVDAASLSVVGLVEVISHIPRIYREFRKLVRAARETRPDLAILTDAPDFHLRLAPKLAASGIPVVYLIAPQVWAWRKGRLPAMRRNLSHLLCIFPFEEEFFRGHGIRTTYIGHPLTRIVRPRHSREDFRSRFGIEPEARLVTLLPGSRAGEAARHLPVLVEAAVLLGARLPCRFLLATPPGLGARLPLRYLTEPNSGINIQHVEGEAWDAIAHADLALAASGTVTIEAALLGTPMVTFYKVTGVSWWLGRFLVDVPFYSMVNLVAGQRVVPELIQNEMRAESIAAEAERLLCDRPVREEMRRQLGEVRRRLDTGEDPMERAASLILELMRNHGEQKLVRAGS